MPDPDPKLSPLPMKAADYKKMFIFITLEGILFFCLYNWVSPRIGFVGYARDCFYLQDYAYHIILTKYFWLTGSGNIYDAGFQFQALTDYLGRPAIAAMPVAVTPIALVVWLPFVYIAQFSLSLVYSLWVTFSIGILALALWRALTGSASFAPRPLLPVVLGGITFCSLVGASAIIVGQTSLFAGGMISFLICRMIRFRDNRDGSPVDWPAVIFAVLAGLKPPYMIIGFGILLIYRRWRELLGSAGVVLLLTAALTPLLTPAWLRSYAHTLGMYSSGNFPYFYAWSIAPRTMNILRSAISGLTGDRAAAVSSTVLSGLTLSAVGLFSLFRPPRDVTWAPRLVVALIACCLLFSPNSGAYEDMLLMPVFVMVLLTGRTPSPLSWQGMGIAGALFVSLLHNIPGIPPGQLWIFFVLKFLVLLSMIRYAGTGNVAAGSCAVYNPDF